MSPLPPPASSEAFVDRTGLTDPVPVQAVWDTRTTPELALPVVAPAVGQKVWAIGLTVKSNRQTMLEVDVLFDYGSGGGYQTSFVVEWSGWNTMHFVVSSLKPIGTPAGLHTVQGLVLKAGSTTFAGTVLELGPVTWLEDSPLVPVTPGEDMIVNFLAERFWTPADWQHTGTAALPAGEQALDVGWMYANLRYLQKPGRHHQTAYTRRMNVDLSPYQAVSVFTATDRRAAFSLILRIDGRDVRVIDRRHGIGGGDEMRATLSGRRLEALTIELAQVAPEITEPVGVQVATSIRWIFLERKGADPAAAGEVRGMPAVPPPVRVGDLEKEILPVGIFVGREEFLRLRDAAQKPGFLKKMADEIIAEAESHLDYRPEPYVGRYLPVDLGNQGCERRVSPADQMYHVNSCMVYSAVAYALTGDVRYGQSARRALFATVACTAWQAGLPSRIPCGVGGYRAPFIETHAAECVALGYDFVYPLLSPEERRAIEDALYEKALPWIDVYLRLKGEGYLLMSNQGAVYTAGLVLSSLVARRSHPDVDEILERGIRWFPRMLANYYKPDGAANEGPRYWEYTTENAVSALIAITRHKGWTVRDYAPAHLPRTMDYMAHLRSLASERLSFLPLGDNIESSGFPYLNGSFLFFARHYGNRNALWLWHEYYARQPKPPGSAGFGKRMTGASIPSALKEFLLYQEAATDQPPLEPATHFPDCDRVVWRTGGRHGDMLFLFEGGPQTFEHTHYDKGQFILEAFGERLATDPGMIKYQDPAHLFYKDTSYHNLVTLRGRKQDYRDAPHAVVIERLQTGGVCDYLVAELGNSYKAFSRYRRAVLFVRPHYFLIVDDVQADQTGLEWNFHSGVPMAEMDLASGLIRWEGKTGGLVLAVSSDRPLQSATGRYESEGLTLAHNLVLTQVDPAPTLSVAALLVPYAKTASTRPQVQVRREGDVTTYTVTGAWGTDRVRCEQGGAPRIQVWRDEGRGEQAWFSTG